MQADDEGLSAGGAVTEADGELLADIDAEFERDEPPDAETLVDTECEPTVDTLANSDAEAT